MLKKIKKHKNKLFILMLTLISALTLFLNVGKTYAYNTDKFSYTINENTILTADNATYDSINKTFTTNTASTNIQMFIDFKDTFTANNAYLLLNYKFEWSYDGSNWNNGLDSNNYRLRMYNYDGNQISDSRNYQIYYDLRTQSNEYTTLVCKFDLSITNKSKAWLRISDLSNNTYNRLTIYNIDIVTPIDVSLNQYYETYYGQIEDNYNTLLSNYNDLQNNYTTLEGNYNDLQDNYDTLQGNYNTLEDSYNNLGNVYSSLWNNIPYFTILNEYYDYSYMSNFSTILQHYNADVFSIDDMKENNVVNGSTLNFSNITSLNNTNDIYNLGIFFSGSYLRNDIEDNWKYLYSSEDINISVVPPITLNNNNKIVLTFKALQSSMRVNVIVITYDDLVTNNFVINKDLLLKKDENFDFALFKYLESMSIIIDKISLQNASQNFILNATASNYYQGYSIGFDEGFNSGRSTQEQIDNTAIQGLTDTINAQQRDITDLRNTIDLISTSNEQLRNEINDINANNLTWQKIFFTMADTPLKTVASVLGKDSGNAFLGINLYDAFIGLITTLVLIWLIKKFI